MKSPVFFLALLALLAVAGSRLAFGQTSHSLSIEAQRVASGATVQNTTNSQAGSAGSSYSAAKVRVTNASEALQINVRNLGTRSDAARLEWYFVAVPVRLEPGKAMREQEFVFDQGSQDLTLAASGTQVVNVESKEVTSAVRTSARGRSGRKGGFSMGNANQKPAESGSALRGWLVRLVADGKVIGARGSSQAYEDLAKDEARLADLTDNEAPRVPRTRSYPAGGSRSKN